MQADFTDDALWAEAAAANDALEALNQAKLLARRRLALHQRAGSSGAPARRIVAIGHSGVLYIGDTGSDGRTPHGNGTLLFADGSQHVGTFDCGRAHGAGMWQGPTGAAAVGKWVNNKRVGVYAAVDASGNVFAEQYATDGRCLSRELRGAAPNPPVLCARCGTRYVPELDHPYGCRRHRAEFVPMRFEQAHNEGPAIRAPGSAGKARSHVLPASGAYRKMLGPSELAQRPRSQRSESALDVQMAGGSDAGDGIGQGWAGAIDNGVEGVWPCCGQHGKRALGCVFETHGEHARHPLRENASGAGAPVGGRKASEPVIPRAAAPGLLPKVQPGGQVGAAARAGVRVAKPRQSSAGKQAQ